MRASTKVFRAVSILLLPMVILIFAADALASGGTQEVLVWIENPMVKVMKEDEMPVGANISNMNLKSARNERDFGQFVLYSTLEDIQTVRLEPTPLRSGSGHEIGLNHIMLHEVGYIYLPTYDEWHPDPLTPSTAINLSRNTAQPVWYEVYVPADVPAGFYSGDINIYLQKELHASIKVNLTVWGFNVPETPSMESSFGLTYGYIDYWHDVEKDSVEAKELYDKYYWYLVDHRMTPRQPPAPFGSAEFEQYVTDPRVTTIQVAADRFLPKNIKWLEDRGLLEKGYTYAVDEPVTKEHYQRLQVIGEAVLEVEPRLGIVVPYWCYPEFAPTTSPVDLMKGYVNIWCPVSTLMDNVNERAKLKERQSMGEKLWWYVCVGPGKPYANLFVDMTGLENRILFWQQELLGIEGFLYWETIFWPFEGHPYGHGNIIESPWVDINTFGDAYGDGSLLYPGKEVGIDGPVPSIRFKLAYKGMVDFEYFRLYEELFGRAALEKKLKRICIGGLTEFIRDPKYLSQIRDEIGEEINKKMSS